MCGNYVFPERKEVYFPTIHRIKSSNRRLPLGTYLKEARKSDILLWVRRRASEGPLASGAPMGTSSVSCIIVNANFLPQLSTLALLSKLINWNLTTTCTHRGRPDRYTHLPNLVALRERKKARKLITTAEDAVSRRSENLRRRKQAKVKKFERRIRRTFFLYTATTKNAFSNFSCKREGEETHLTIFTIQ